VFPHEVIPIDCSKHVTIDNTKIIDYDKTVPNTLLVPDD
jgi:hypothetical protein